MGHSESNQVVSGFQMPGDPEQDVYLLPVSGGADSSALAILLHELAPHINFRMVFTDTGAEEEATLASLDRLEGWLGKRIERLSGPGLFDLIEQYGGFLPSPRDRWCTRELKLKPFQDWLVQFKGRQKWMFIGIRRDEAERVAFTIPEVETVMPFVDLGLDRAWVYRKLASTIGIPVTYKTRTRSGCATCPYQRASELVGLLQRSPAEFEKGAQYEKLSPADATRHPQGVPLWQDTAIAANWHSLPMPTEDSGPTGLRFAPAKAADMFNARIFLGGEFFVDGMPGMGEFVWQQRVVCFSTTLAGVKRQLDGRYQHLLATAEVQNMTADEVREQARFAIWYVELPSEVFDPEGPRDGGYTWQQGKSYRQIRHVIEWGTRALHAEFQRKQAAMQPNPLSVQHEWTEGAKEAMAGTVHPQGAVLYSQWYQPSEKVAEPETEEEALRLLPCPMCHI